MGVTAGIGVTIVLETTTDTAPGHSALRRLECLAQKRSARTPLLVSQHMVILACASVACVSAARASVAPVLIAHAGTPRHRHQSCTPRFTNVPRALRCRSWR